MASNDDKDFFDRLGEILNAPLPGTQRGRAPEAESDDDDEDTVLERIKDILKAPLPGTELPETQNTGVVEQGAPAPAEAAAATPAAETLAPDAVIPEPEDMEENWWDHDWEAFRAHQEKQRQGFNLKQRRDQENFARYQEQEKARIDAHQKHDFDVFRQQQQWKLEGWKRRIEQQAGNQPPAPGWRSPPSPWANQPPSGPSAGHFQPPGRFPPPRRRR